MRPIITYPLFAPPNLMYPGKSSKDALDVNIVLQQFSFECSFVQTNQKNLILTYLNRRSNFPVLTNAMTNQVRVRYVQVGAFVRRCALSKTVHRSYFDGKSCPLGSQLCYAACSLARLVSPLFAPARSARKSRGRCNNEPLCGRAYCSSHAGWKEGLSYPHQTESFIRGWIK
jgi:hypothetical protein